MKFCEREFGMGGEGYIYVLRCVVCTLKAFTNECKFGRACGVCVCIYVICPNRDISSLARGQKRTPKEDC